MYILKKQAEESQPIPVVLSIPLVNEGSIVMKDPESEQPMSVFPVKTVLFCARGNAEELLDCFCLNIRHRRSGMYHCHVFHCEIREAVSYIHVYIHVPDYQLRAVHVSVYQEMIVTKLLSDDDLHVHVLCLCSVRRFLTPLEKLSKPR